jgi:hypothetical protein
LTSISIASGSAPQRQGSPTLPNPRDTTSSDERNEKSLDSLMILKLPESVDSGVCAERLKERIGLKNTK